LFEDMYGAAGLGECDKLVKADTADDIVYILVRIKAINHLLGDDTKVSYRRPGEHAVGDAPTRINSTVRHRAVVRGRE